MQTDSSQRLLRLKSIIAPHGPICVSRSTWWAKVRSGVYPKPVHLGKRITAWREEDIRKLAQDGVQTEQATVRKVGNSGDRK